MSDEKPVSGDVSEHERRSGGRGGRPEYKPTDEQRAKVAELAGKGTARGEIAKAIGVSATTLRKHFEVELNQAGQAVEPSLSLLDLPERPAPAPAQAPKATIDAGRPEFEPSSQQREDVKLCKADNWSDERIAQLLGISRNTLLKYFADELDRGADLVRIQVLRHLKAASAKGSRPAAEAILNLPGMVAPLERLPVPESDAPPPADRVGKKEQANRDALTAHEGTSWSQILKH